MISTIWMLLILTQALILPVETGVISGKLNTGTGASAVGVRVAVMVAPDPAMREQPDNALVSITETGKDGRYVLDNIPPGRYYITAGRIDSPTYYPGTPDAAKGMVVTILARQKIDGLNFTLQEQSVGQQTPVVIASPILGQVIVQGGGQPPILWPKLYVLVAGSDGTRFVVQEDGSARATKGGAAARVESNGHFQLPSLLKAGEYTVSLQTGFGPELPDSYSVKSITFGDRDVLKQKLQIPANSARSLVITIGVSTITK